RECLEAGGVMSDDFIDGYTDLKMQEVTRFRAATHPLEYQMYYGVCRTWPLPPRGGRAPPGRPRQHLPGTTSNRFMSGGEPDVRPSPTPGRALSSARTTQRPGQIDNTDGKDDTGRGAAERPPAPAPGMGMPAGEAAPSKTGEGLFHPTRSLSCRLARSLLPHSCPPACSRPLPPRRKCRARSRWSVRSEERRVGKEWGCGGWSVR